MPSVSSAGFQPQSVTILSDGAARTGDAGKGNKKGFGFGDFIDMINPLHHIPVVGQVYRAVTGDQISDKARLAGGGLFAGPLGIGIAAGTIALRKDKEAELAPPQEQQLPQQTISVPVAQNLDGYQAIAAKHWTPETLNALATSINADIGRDLAGADKDKQEEVPAPERAPIAQVGSQPLPGTNSPIVAQMLSNLEKYEAMSEAQR